MDERVGVNDLEMDRIVTSTPFDNSVRRETFIISEEDKENEIWCSCRKKGARKKWDPDLPVVLPPWVESDGEDCCGSEDKVLFTSSTFIISKETSASPTGEVKLKNKNLCNKAFANQGPVNISNNVFTKHYDKKDGRRSVQVFPKENKKKLEQRRSLDVRKVAAKPTSVAGLPQRRLKLKKSTTSVKLREPLPYASKSTLYDEHWSYKQERAFTKWLNYILAPLDCYGNTIPTNGKKVDNTGQLQFMEQDPVNLAKVPISPFHSGRREARLRESACLLYQSSSLEDVFLKLEVEVETRRLSMRLDRTVYSDVGLRQQLIDLLNSYNTPWLRLGVEVLFGEVLPMHTAGGELVDFGVYCVRRLCENDDISQAYMCKMGTHGPGYEEALLQFAYRKLLMMIVFLDKAKMGRLMDNDPCLFVKNADVKSSKQVLLSLSHLFLCGEGDVVKHLRLLGYTLHHIQRPLDEYDYTVMNLATDLRDGIRLCRLTEMLTNKWELSQQLRVPAAGKTQKLHNVDAVLKMLRQHISFPKLVTAQTIVQGHRELTLSLLWSIIFHFKVDLQLDQDELRKEIEQLKGQSQHPIAHANFFQRRASLEGSIFFQSPTISLLLQWCQAVCAIYGVTVTNFSTSFCDGRVFCYIIHHYHPSLLPLESIKNDTSLTAIPPPPVEEPVIDDFEKNWTRSFSPTTNKEKTEIIANEKANFKLLSEKILLLGGMPPIVMSKDMVDTIPDEKVVITYTSYLCKQLLCISNEVRASMVIQRAWRRLHVKIELKKKLMKRDAAAVLIQANVRRYLAQVSYQRTRRAIAVIQHHWRAQCEMLKRRGHYLLIQQAVLVIQRKFRAYREARRHGAAQIIQAHIRGHLQFCQYERLKHAAQVIQLTYRKHLATLEAEKARRQCAVVRIQSYWRKCMHQRSYLKLKHVCTIIQQRYRAKVLADEARNVFEAKKTAAVTIQAAFRSFRAHKMFLTWKHATIIIQQWYRSVVVSRETRSDYQETVRCVCIVQRCVKEWFNHRSQAAITLQASVRGYTQRCRYIRMQVAAIIIQQRYRAHQLMVQCRQHYCQFKSSCTVIQAAVKAWMEQRRYKQMQSAALKIQSWYKGQVVRQRYMKMRKASCVIACHWKAVLLGRVQRLAYLNLYSKIVRLQAAVRGQLCRKWVRLCHASAAVIQKAYRKHLLRRYQAVTKIQATFKAYHARQLFLTLKQATSIIQVRYRALKEGRKLHKEYGQMRASIIVIQAVYRGHLAHKNYMQLKIAALTVQANWRRHKEQRRYYVTREAILCIQQWYRWAHQGRLLHQRYLRLRCAAITIQRGFVEYRQRKQLRAAVKIQSVVRCIFVRKKYLQMIRASVAIQAFTRGYLVRSHIKSLTNAVRKVEVYYKAKLVGRRVQREYQQTRAACILLQSAFRGWNVRHYFVKLQTTVQMVEEAWLARQQRLQYLYLKQSAIIIQRWYRSVLLTRLAHMQYLRIKSAVVVIQSFVRGWAARSLYRSHCAARKIQSNYRGYKARSQFLRTQNACVTIQSWIRRYCDRKNYLTTKAAALVIQSRIRALRCGRDTRNQYLQLTNAAILIQATYKAKKQRFIFLELKEKAIVIQARCRMCVARYKYLNIRRAAITLQAYIRSYLLTKAISNDYRMLREAAVTVQCYTRAHQQRTKYLQLRQAAVTIQSTLRMYQCRKLYQEKMVAVLVLQRHTRALLSGRRVRCAYATTRGAAIVIQRAYRERRATRRYHAAVTIQSHYRRYMAQKRYRMLRTATISIQQFWRVQRCQKHYHKLRRAALIIQSRIRALRCGRDTRNQYLQLTNAAILIQATYKARKQRRVFLELKEKTIFIEAQFRMCIVRRQYLIIRRATITLQAHIRSYLLTKAISNNYRLLREAAITVQCYARAHQQRTKYLQLRQAAVTIQSTLRMYQCRKLYQEKRSAVFILQRHTRALLLGRRVRCAYATMRGAAIVIQRAYREHQAMRHYRAAVTVQSHYRRYMAQMRYNSLQTAAISIQRYWRGRQCYEHYHKLRQASLIIQSRIRALCCGRDARRKYLQLTNAAILIQAAYKARKQRCIFLKLKEKVVTIQAQYRMCVVRRQYLNIRRAGIALQAHIRSHLLTKAISNDYRMLREAAITVQCYTRAHQQRTKYLQLRQAAVTIQSTLRMYQCRKLYQEKLTAVLVLQRHTRALLSGRRVRCAYATMRGTAIVIQRAYRERRATRHYRAAVTIQSHYRRYMAQKRYNSWRTAAISIQRYWRGRCCVVHFNRMKAAAFCLQRSYRVHALRVKIHQEIERKIRAAILIQAVYRGHLCYSKFTRVCRATLTLQSYFRRVRAQKEFNHVRNNVIFIQQKWRATLLARSMHAEFEAKQRAALVIQQYYRGYRLMKETRYQYVSLWTASVTLQRTFRQYLTYRQQQKLMAATCIQRAYRHYKRTVEIKKRVEFVERFSYLALIHLSAILIQHSWRCYQHKLLQQRRHFAAIKLQVWYKMLVTRRRYTKLLSSVITVQQLCRHQIESIHQRKLHHCATIIQAHWRGYHVRRQVGSQIEEIRSRIKRASSEERQRVTLRDQMPSLLQLLIKGKYLSHGSYVLEKLELITRLSDGCSLVLVEAGALPVLYDVINSTNRNRASLWLVETTLQILLNLTKWSCTSPDVLQHDAFVSTIVRLMQKVYISQSDIMQRCCQLLYVYCNQQDVKLVQNRLAPEVRRLRNMAATLRDKLLILGKKWHHKAMTPLIQLQHEQFQSSLSSLERVLGTSIINTFSSYNM